MSDPVRSYVMRTVKGVFSTMGLDVRRLAKSPGVTYLGLRGRPIRSVIDVGANVGQFARRAAAAFPEATFYCFEPLPDAYATLKAWADEAAPRRITTFNLALGEAEGRLTFHRHVDHTDSSSALASTPESRDAYEHTRQQVTETVRVRTLDAVMRELATPPAAEVLVKLDVQGYEEHVIRGGRETIGQAAAVIAEVCLDPLYEGQATFAGIHAALAKHGLEYRGNLDQACAEDGHVIFLDAVFERRRR